MPDARKQERLAAHEQQGCEHDTTHELAGRASFEPCFIKRKIADISQVLEVFALRGTARRVG